MNDEITADFLLKQGFKMEDDKYIIKEWSWKKFSFVKIKVPNSNRTIFTREVIQIIIEGPGAHPAVYLKIGNDTPRRCDELTKSQVKNLIVGLLGSTTLNIYNTGKVTTLGNIKSGGFFVSIDGGTLGFKSDYVKDDLIEAYCVDTGEMFWGGAEKRKDQKYVSVYKCKVTKG